MSEARIDELTIAIDPTSCGFAFAVLEGPDRLVDWGTRYVARGDRNASCVVSVNALVRKHAPDALAIEDCDALGSRRCRRVRVLIRKLTGTAALQTLTVRLVSPRLLCEICTGSRDATKHEVAVSLTRRFPELARHLPPPRKPWMTEDVRMSVFDAVGLAVAAVYRRPRNRAIKKRP